jgi:hypothetical protein
VLLWFLVLVGCAGVGAVIAARTNPFPPGVEGGPVATPSPTPQARTWTLRFESVSSHRLYVGGSCRSRWKGSVKVTASSDGAIDGSGQARLVGRRTCDSPNAQIQSKVLDLFVRGNTKGSGLVLRIRVASTSPSGSHDYGGFVATVLRRALTLSVGNRKLRLSARDSSGKETYSSKTAFVLSCTAGCTPT